MIQLDERGKQCPLPVIEAKKALENCPAGESVRVIVDNEIAVQNLLKMAGHKDLKAEAEKISDDEFAVCIEAGDSIGQAGDTDGGRQRKTLEGKAPWAWEQRKMPRTARPASPTRGGAAPWWCSHPTRWGRATRRWVSF